MFASLKNHIRPAHLALGGLLLVALMLGTIVPNLVVLMDGKLSKLLAVPALFALGFLLLYDRRMMVLLIILFRSCADIFLDQTRFSLGGAQIGVGGLINAFVILIALLMVLEKPKAVPKSAYTMWAAFLLLSMIGIVLSPTKGEAIRAWLTQLSYFAMFISAFYFIRTREDFDYCVKVVLWSSVLPVLYGFVDIARNHNIAYGGGPEGFRVHSTFGHPNIFAFYLTLVITLSFYVFRSLPTKLAPGRRVDYKWTYRPLLLCYMAVLVLMLMHTKTRSAWLSLVITFALYALIFDRRYFLFLLVGGVGASLVPEVRDRLGDLLQGNHVGNYAQLNSFAWRVYLWKSGLNWMAPSHYAFGYGLQAFKEYSPVFFPLAGNVNWGAHSVFVQWLFDIGVIGTLSYLFLYYKVLRVLRGMLKFNVLGGFFVGMNVVNFLICAASDNMLDYLSYNWYLWFIVGAGCAAVYHASDKPAGRPV